jgi:two-component system sensor histidine kinase DesK
MAVAVAISAPSFGPSLGTYHPALMVGSRRGHDAEAVRHAAAWGAIALSILLPAVILLSYAVGTPSSNHLLLALAATSVYLPLQVRHVRYGLRGLRPPWLPGSLLAMAIAVLAPTPILGAYWLYAFHALAASVLVTLRPRLSVPLVACILVVSGIWGRHFGGVLGNDVYVYMPAAVLQRAMGVAVLVWLVRVLGTIQLASVALAEQALAAERSRLDDDIGRTVGLQLASAVRRGERALELARVDARTSQQELESLIDGARGALAEARRLIGRFKLVSSHTELQQAAAILRSAGIAVDVDIPEDVLPPVLDEPLRASLRSLVARLLADGTSSPLVIRLTRSPGGDRFEASTRSVEPAA